MLPAAFTALRNAGAAPVYTQGKTFRKHTYSLRLVSYTDGSWLFLLYRELDHTHYLGIITGGGKRWQR